MNNFWGIVVSVIFMVIIFISAKVFDKVGKEASRKYIHIMLSNWWIIAMVFFTNLWWASVLPAMFIVINYISLKKDVIKVMEREEGDENKDSFGTVYYAISLFILALITFGPMHNPLVGLCGIIVMGYGDGLAAVIGKAIKSKEYKVGSNTKSVAGSLTMFVVTLLVVAGFFYYFTVPHWILKSIFISALITIIEAISIKGTDNLTVPLLTSFLVYLMM